ncbi:hypothetical protein D7X33_15350 [Butyricicoccus sp. 1XD8-22]|nr:hypothetical protein D7X33_15350 [Butyricicoccus sp. 1XD8-22]
MKILKRIAAFAVIMGLAISMTTISAVGASTESNFKDVQTTDWYYSAVRDMIAKNAISGYSDNTFRPDQPISRAEYAKMLFQNMPMSTPKGNPSEELKAAYLRDYNSFGTTELIIEALQRGIVELGADPVDWNKPITRSEIAYFTYMACETTNYQHTLFLDPGIGRYFGDYGDCLGDRYCIEILIMLSSGIMGGTAVERNFILGKTVSRAEACVIVGRMVQSVPRIDTNTYDMKHIDAPLCSDYILYGYSCGKKNYDTAPIDYNHLAAVKKGTPTGAKYGGMTSKEAAEAQAIADQFVKNYIRPTMSEVEKVCVAAEYIMTNCNYDNGSGTRAYTAWGALVEHQAWCTGFTHAFNLLCDAMDIGCVAVSANSAALNPSHMWNEVRIDDYWYVLDVQTMDLLHDFLMENREELRIDDPDPNFLVSSSAFIGISGMQWNTDKYPVCEYNYFDYGQCA